MESEALVNQMPNSLQPTGLTERDHQVRSNDLKKVLEIYWPIRPKSSVEPNTYKISKLSLNYFRTSISISFSNIYLVLDPIPCLD